MRHEQFVRVVHGATLVAALVGVAVVPAHAQSWRRFDVADSSLDAAVRAAGSRYEPAWNDLLVAALRARAANADSAARLLLLARRVAAAETRATGGRIAADALALQDRWNAPQRASRVRAAEQESLGVAEQAARRFEPSERALVTALNTYTSLGERRRRAWLFGTIGSGRFVAGDMAGADSLYRLALAARREIGDSSLVARALNTLGSVALQQSRLQEALSWFAQARAVRERLDEPGPLATTLNYMSSVATWMGLQDSAKVWLPRALELATSAGDSVRVADVLVQLATFRADEGRPAEAEALANRALAIAAPAGQARIVVQARHALAKSLVREGRYTDAATALDEAVGLARDTGDSRILAELLVTLGNTWVQLRDGPRARPPLEEADSLATVLGDPGLHARALDNLALARRLDGDDAGAYRDASQALAFAGQLGDSSLVVTTATTLGQIAYDRNDLARARACFQRAATAATDPGSSAWILARNNLAVLDEREGHLDAAEAGFRTASERAAASGLSEHAWPSILGLGDVAERRGRTDEALTWYRRAAGIIDTMRAGQSDERGAIAFFANRLFVYEALVHLLGKLEVREPGRGHDAEAFQWAERARARALLDLLHAVGREKSPAATLTLDDARRLAGAGALLVYSTGDSSSTGWVVTRNGSTRFTLPPAPALRIRVLKVRDELMAPASSDHATTAVQAAHDLLIGPALPALANVKRLVIVPDGPLSLLPFEALQAGAKAKYLIERFDVSYVPSVSSLAALSERARASGEVLALGDPAFRRGNSKLPPLPGTRDELNTLRTLSPPRPFAALTGTGATRRALLGHPWLTDADILHLATHGVADADDPSRSGLWFAADSVSDFLSATDVLGLRLRARLVVLSACESGLGRLERGEGVLGLPRAFLAAGAGSVIVSLWSVSDQTSALLMRRFYEGLLRSGLSRDRALAEAKRGLLRISRNGTPGQWAPFVLVGGAGTMGDKGAHADTAVEGHLDGER